MQESRLHLQQHYVETCTEAGKQTTYNGQTCRAPAQISSPVPVYTLQSAFGKAISY